MEDTEKSKNKRMAIKISKYKDLRYSNEYLLLWKMLVKILILCRKKYIIIITTKLIDLLGTLLEYSQSFGYIIYGRLLIGEHQ